MYENNPIFKAPKDENTKIWHYMDFTKFVSLLDTKALFFTRVDQLDDEFEGSITRFDLDPSFQKATSEERTDFLRHRMRMTEVYKWQREELAVNCWHMNEDESAAMWKLYLKSDEGLVIQSTYQRLINSFDSHDSVNTIWVGVVNYGDYKTINIPVDEDTLYPFLYKQKWFDYERELRAVVVQKKTMSNVPKGQSWIGGSQFLKMPKDGIKIPVNLDVMIENIYTSPKSKDWFVELVKSITKRFSLNNIPKLSSMTEKSTFV